MRNSSSSCKDSERIHDVGIDAYARMRRLRVLPIYMDVHSRYKGTDKAVTNNCRRNFSSGIYRISIMEDENRLTVSHSSETGIELMNATIELAVDE
jgi:hypothetical protein